MPDFNWTNEKVEAAEMLAEGHLIKEVAAKVNRDVHTIYNWRQESAFEEEVNRLTMMRGLAIRAERARVAKRAIRKMVDDETGDIKTNKDPLDWMKYLQSETNGAIFSIPDLAAFIANPAPVAGSGQSEPGDSDRSATGEGGTSGSDSEIR